MPLVIIILWLFLIPGGRGCACGMALDDDLPHGANETLEYRLQTVRDIHGTVFLPDDTLAGDVVVEVYDLPDKKLASYDFVREHSRRTACVTAADGNFCFANLPSGNYLLRVGTRSERGMNEAYIKVTVDRRWFSSWFRQSKPIELGLTLGT